MWEAENGGRWEGFSSAGGCLIQNPPTAFPLSSVQLIVGRKKEISLLTFTQYTHFFFFFFTKMMGESIRAVTGNGVNQTLENCPQRNHSAHLVKRWKRLAFTSSWQKKPFYSRRNNDSSLWGAESEVISCYKNLSERKRLRSRIGCTKRVTPTGPCWFYL